MVYRLLGVTILFIRFFFCILCGLSSNIFLSYRWRCVYNIYGYCFQLHRSVFSYNGIWRNILRIFCYKSSSKESLWDLKIEFSHITPIWPMQIFHTMLFHTNVWCWYLMTCFICFVVEVHVQLSCFSFTTSKLIRLWVYSVTKVMNYRFLFFTSFPFLKFSRSFFFHFHYTVIHAFDVGKKNHFFMFR